MKIANADLVPTEVNLRDSCTTFAELEGSLCGSWADPMATTGQNGQLEYSEHVESLVATILLGYEVEGNDPNFPLSAPLPAESNGFPPGSLVKGGGPC